MRLITRACAVAALIGTSLAVTSAPAGADFEAPMNVAAFIKINPPGATGDENTHVVPGDDDEWPVAKVTFEYDGDAGLEVDLFELEFWDTSQNAWAVAPGVNTVDPDASPPDPFVFLSNYYTPSGDVAQKIRVVAVDDSSAREASAALEFVSSPDNLADDWLPVLPLSDSYEPVNPVTPFRVDPLTTSPAKECDLFPADSVLHADVRNADVDTTGNATLLDYEDGLNDDEDETDTTFFFGAGEWDSDATKVWGIPYSEAAGTDVNVQRMARIEYPAQWYGPATAYPDYGAISRVPIPSGISISDTEDDAAIVVDHHTSEPCELHEMWELHGPNFGSAWATHWPWTHKTIGWGAKSTSQYLNSANVDGTPTVSSQPVNGYSYFDPPHGGVNTGGLSVSHIPVLPLLLTVNDLEADSIDHPLAFVASDTLGPTGAQWPALNGDGTRTSSQGALPIGIWLRLKPGINIDAVFQPTPRARKILQALKVHGMILVDTSGTAGSFGIRSEGSHRWEDPVPGAGTQPTAISFLEEIEDAFEAFMEPTVGDNATTNITHLFEVVDADSDSSTPPAPMQLSGSSLQVGSG